jgi:molybdenum cofactor cytidylyltransferase
MFRLGDELAASGWCVVATSSTRLGADQINLASHTIVLPDRSTRRRTDTDINDIVRLPGRLSNRSPTLLIGEIDLRQNKAIGLAPHLIDRVASLTAVDVVINEADGARELPFKAPAGHEPVITPATTLVVPVVGLDVIGQPLDDAHVHRPEQVVALTGAELGQPVTFGMITAVLTHPQGGLKGVPPGARVVALINKVRFKADLEMADHLADLLLDCPQVEAVAIGAVQEADPVRLVKGRVAAVVLAAGESRRFGSLKQLLPWGDGTLLTHAVDVALASGARPVIVVLGCQADACRGALDGRAVTTVVNPDWVQGQSTSVRSGLDALPENVGAAIFHLVDLPGVTPEVIDALIARHAVTLAPAVWPEYQAQRGNPVLFDRVAFPRLRGLSGDMGGKPVLLSYTQTGLAERVAVDEPGILLDIDSPADLPQL